MRILHLYAGNLYGGVETLLTTLARHRSLAAMEPTFALCFEGRLSCELRELGADVQMLGPARFAKPWTVHAARQNLRRLLGRRQFDIAICHSAWPHALFARTVRNADLPLVFWAHGPASGHWLERLANRTPPELVVVNSEHTLTTQGNLFGGCEKNVLRMPVSSPPVVEQESVDRIRHELLTASDEIVIACFGRMEAGKGHALLLSALKKLKDLPGWRAWIAGAPQRAGEEEYFRSLQAFTSAAGLNERVRFIGERRDVPDVLRAADIYCQPNLSPESFGIAFVEALYAGLPVVTTNIGAAPEIVNDECGRLVSANEDQLAKALKDLIEDAALRRRLGSAGPKRAAELCDPVIAMPAIERELNCIIESARVA